MLATSGRVKYSSRAMDWKMGFMLIGEFASKTGTTPRMLRHYEDTGLLSPVGRDNNGYRIYDPEQAPRARQIQSLLASGMPATLVRRLLEALTDTRGIYPEHVDNRVRSRERVGTHVPLRRMHGGPSRRAPRVPRPTPNRLIRTTAVAGAVPIGRHAPVAAAAPRCCAEDRSARRGLRRVVREHRPRRGLD